MFEKLQQRWKVNGWNLLLVLLTFALGGSLCGYAGRKLMLWTGLEKGVLWVVIYILIITLIWPFCVLLISIPLGQFNFFKSYIRKILGRMTGKKKDEPLTSKSAKLALFASGAGSNALNIITYFENHPLIEVTLIVCNNPDAGVRNIARAKGMELLMIDRNGLNDPSVLLAAIRNSKIDYLILAGFLWKIPKHLVEAFPKKIINIHPALLPKFGGKGMFGQHVHEAVIAAREQQSGITIHLVDELYDHGEHLFQASCLVEAQETTASLAQKIHGLEQVHFPKVIEDYIKKAKS